MSCYSDVAGTCLTECPKSYMESLGRQLSITNVLYYKVQWWVHICYIVHGGPWRPCLEHSVDYDSFADHTRVMSWSSCVGELWSFLVACNWNSYSYWSSPCCWHDTFVGPESRQAGLQHLCNVLLLASPAEMGLMLLGAKSAVTLVHAFVMSRGLLKRHSCWTAQIIHHWQAPESTNYWMLLLALSATHKYDRGLSRCLHNGWMFLSECCSPLSAVKSSTLHDGMLHANLRHYLSAASAVCQLWLSGPLCRWSDGLKFATGHCLWSDTFFWQFLAWFKNFLLSLLSYTVH